MIETKVKTFLIFQWAIVAIIIILIVKSCLRRSPPVTNFESYQLNVQTQFVKREQYVSQDHLMTSLSKVQNFAFAFVAGRPLKTSVDLSSLMRPCFDQGPLGSCTAQALIGASQYISSKRMDSALFLYQNERLLDNTVNQDAGSYVSTGISAMQKQGLCKESSWPQIVSKYKAKPPPNAQKEALTKKVKTAQQVPIQNEAIQNWLASGFPVIVGIRVYRSFQNASKSGQVPMPGVSDAYLGGHAVLLVGQDSSRQLYKVRNSWGTSWGLSGYFYLPQAYITKPQMASDLWVIVKSDNPN